MKTSKLLPKITYFSLSILLSYLQLVMAASVYATPPPDHLSGDETALSDVSNSSQLSSPKSLKTLKHSLSATSLPTSDPASPSAEPVAADDDDDDAAAATVAAAQSPTSNAITFATNLNITCMTAAALNAANNSSSSANNIDTNSISSVDSVPDFSKKRRKQSTPIRISATAAAAAAAIAAATGLAPPLATDENDDIDMSPALDDSAEYEDTGDSKDAEESPIPRIFLSDLSQLQAKNKLFADYAQKELLASFKSEMVSRRSPSIGEKDDDMVRAAELLRKYPNNLNCDQCGLKLDSEVELGLHIVQEHGAKRSDENDKPKTRIKREPVASNWNDDDEKQLPVNGNVKPEDWLSLAGLPFPFPPEAAAMLSASGYLPQLPMLGVGGVSSFGADTMNRSNGPPLRIFNPEAYCELCNKEFCNKYFLKTHKANKHNIYEPTAPTTDGPSTSQLNHMSQVLQMQQQQIAQQQQAIAPTQTQSVSAQSTSNNSSGSSTTGSSAAQESSVFCDVCFKRFTNVFAMRRHRSKMHEIPPPTADTVKAEKSNATSNNSASISIPEGFREDFTVEQEDTSFTPQPRKLSPQSILQAREANFSVDKLKRLGVVNPEAFCEICCKEYCNKYFLRTHKIKRHGIFMPPDESTGTKEERAAAAAASAASAASAAAAAASAWQFLQNSPLNLMMGSAEQLTQQLALHNQKRSYDQHALRKLSIESDDDNKHENGQMTPPNDDHDDNDAKSLDDQQHQQDSEAISVDLQKLQSMILQLNDLNNQRPVNCVICGKEQDNQFALQSHMITEHANLGENNNGHKNASPVTSPSVANTSEQCKHCDKEFPNAFAMTQHMFEAHSVPQSTSPVREGFVTPERPVSSVNIVPATPNDRRPYTITPTSSYCEICNKELCNKYFMKTHMQRMHGIEIENGAQIGGVVCNICNKELCSKYFLRVHKHNTHGIVDDGSPLPQSRQTTEPTEPETAFPASGEGNSSSNEASDVGSRYFAHFQEVCPICSRRFRGAKWLRTHLMSDHGKAGTDKLRELEQQLAGNLPKPASSPTLKIPNRAFGTMNAIEANFINKHQLSGVFGANTSPNDETVTTPLASSKNKEYHCTFCPFSTPSLTFLYVHERTHSLLGGGAVNGGSNGHLSNNQSESAVSIAKDLQRMGQPPGLLASLSGNGGHNTSSASETPTSTPATTPVPVPLSTQEAALSKADRKAERQHRNQQKHLAESRIPEPHMILNEMANATQRPTSYAIPQTIDGAMTMQSFLMEPMAMDSSDDDDDHIGHRLRFVPSVVFLPVRERVAGRVVVSFTLTPA